MFIQTQRKVLKWFLIYKYDFISNRLIYLSIQLVHQLCSPRAVEFVFSLDRSLWINVSSFLWFQFCLRSLYIQSHILKNQLLIHWFFSQKNISFKKEMEPMVHFLRDHQYKMAKTSKAIGCLSNMLTMRDAAHQKAVSNHSLAFILIWPLRHRRHHLLHLMVPTAWLASQEIQVPNNWPGRIVRCPWLLPQIQIPPAHR